MTGTSKAVHVNQGEYTASAVMLLCMLCPPKPPAPPASFLKAEQFGVGQKIPCLMSMMINPNHRPSLLIWQRGFTGTIYYLYVADKKM